MWLEHNHYWNDPDPQTPLVTLGVKGALGPISQTSRTQGSFSKWPLIPNTEGPLAQQVHKAICPRRRAKHVQGSTTCHMSYTGAKPHIRPKGSRFGRIVPLKNFLVARMGRWFRGAVWLEARSLPTAGVGCEQRGFKHAILGPGF